MSCTTLYSSRVIWRCCEHQADSLQSWVYLNQIPQVCNKIFLFSLIETWVVASKLFLVEGEQFYFIIILVLCCVERCWWLLVALTTTLLDFVLFVARLQHGCLLFQGCGPKFWVLNDALDPHNMKSTNGWAQYVRKGTENVRVAGRNEWLCKEKHCEL